MAVDRRRFLQTTFASGLAVGGAGCVTRTGGSQAPLADDALERKLRRLDANLARMNSKGATRWYLETRSIDTERPREAREVERLRHEGSLLRASLRSALVASTVAELPEPNRSDPRVVERVRAMSGEADFAVFGTLAQLAALSDDELEALDRDLADADAPGSEVAATIDELSQTLDVPASRRMHLRQMAKHVDWRLSRERFSTLVRSTIDDVVRSVEAAVRNGEGLSLVPAGGDPEWIANTEDVVRFYAPPGDVPVQRPEPATAEQPSPTEQPPPEQPPPASETQPTPPQPTPPQPIPPSEGGLAPAGTTPAPGQLPSHQAPVGPNYGDEIAEIQANAAADGAELEKAQRDNRRGKIMLGTGGGLVGLGAIGIGVGFAVLGVGAAGIVLLSFGGVALTAAVILLIVGAVFVARSNKVLRGT